MASKTLNFMSYNSTGLDTVKTKWIREIIKTCKIDFFQLQEHFKIIESLDSFFRREFSSNDSFVIPGHREAFQDAGRAKGGLAQLSCKTLDGYSQFYKNPNMQHSHPIASSLAAVS